MKTQLSKALYPVLLGALALLVAIGFLTNQGASAAPPLAPTPVANLNNSDDALNVTFFSVQNITADTNTVGTQLGVYEWLDVQYVITHGTVNSITIVPQYSNNNTQWTNGAVLTTNSVVSGTDITRIPMFGRYLRFSIDVTNTNGISVAIIGIAK